MSEWRIRTARAILRFFPALPMARAFQAGSTVTVTWRPFPLGWNSTFRGPNGKKTFRASTSASSEVLDHLDLSVRLVLEPVDDRPAGAYGFRDLARVDQEHDLVLRVEAVLDARAGPLLEQPDEPERLGVEGDLGHRKGSRPGSVVYDVSSERIADEPGSRMARALIGNGFPQAAPSSTLVPG